MCESLDFRKSNIVFVCMREYMAYCTICKFILFLLSLYDKIGKYEYSEKRQNIRDNS